MLFSATVQVQDFKVMYTSITLWSGVNKITFNYKRVTLFYRIIHTTNPTECRVSSEWRSTLDRHLTNTRHSVGLVVYRLRCTYKWMNWLYCVLYSYTNWPNAFAAHICWVHTCNANVIFLVQKKRLICKYCQWRVLFHMSCL